MKAIFVLLLAVTALQPSLVMAEGTRGGGDGIKRNGKIYLLDLFEAGMESNPFFDSSTKPDPYMYEAAKNSLSAVEKAPTYEVAQKLTEVMNVNQLTGLALKKALELYSWRLVAAHLVDVDDTDGSDVQFPKKDLVQLAVRNERIIRINRDFWLRLSVAHRAALIIHELVYALNPDQSSPQSREIVGYIFSPELKSKGYSGLKALAVGKLPFAGYTGWTKMGELIVGNPFIDVHSGSWGYPRNQIYPERLNDSAVLNSIANNICGKISSRVNCSTCSADDRTVFIAPVLETFPVGFARHNNGKLYLSFAKQEKRFEYSGLIASENYFVDVVSKTAVHNCTEWVKSAIQKHSDFMRRYPNAKDYPEEVGN